MMRRLAQATIISESPVNSSTPYDHQDEAKRENQAGEKSGNAPGEFTGAGHYDRHEHRAETDKGAGEKPEDNEPDRIASGLCGARGFAGQRHVRR